MPQGEEIPGLMGWDLEEKLGLEFCIDSYPSELRNKWLEERKKRGGKMEAVYQPEINPVSVAQQTFGQLLQMAVQAETQTSRLHGTFMQLLRDLKSGEVTLDELQVGENGFSILPPAPPVPEPESNGTRPKRAEKVAK